MSKRSSWKRSTKLWIGLLGLLLLAWPLGAAWAAGGLEEAQKKAAAQFRNLSAAEQEALSRELAQALEYYYQDEYERALPAFRAIAEKVETLDVMFWIGISAAKTGEFALSIEKYRQMLAIDPGLHRVRLELADALMGTGDLEGARQELLAVRDATPPPPEGVVKNIEKRLAFIEKRGRKLSWSASLTQGYQYDDNVGAVPEDPLLFGTGILSFDRKQGDSWLTQVRGGVRYDLGSPQGWLLAADASLFHSNQFNHAEFNYTAFDLTVGPWLVFRQDIFKLPFGVSSKEWENDPLSESWHVNPSYEHFFAPWLGVRAGGSYTVENYSALDDSDNIAKVFSIGPNFYLDQRRHVFSAYLSWENHNAEADRNAYDGDAITVSYFGRILPQTDISAIYRWSDRNYNGAPPLFTEHRIDRRQVAGVTVTQRFRKRFFASLGYTYIDNESTAGVYAFDKNIVTLNFGVTY